jgi:hypothetical protein
MKVPLVQKKDLGFGKERMLQLRKSLPFFERENGVLTHRIKSMRMHFDGEALSSKHTHTSVELWCGMHGFVRSRPKRGTRPTHVVSEPSDGRFMCATCEGRAIGSGQLGSREIAGREVMFRPRGAFAA